MGLEPLKRGRFPAASGPVLTVVMDGVGVGPENEGNAVRLARTPLLDRLRREVPYTELLAHGTAVGLPSDEDMGNSEVGHNALGAGRVFAQGARLVNEALNSGALFAGPTWKALVKRAQSGALHLIGLLSDGNVHSHIDHLFRLIDEASRSGVTKLYVHILLDGRDVKDPSSLEYVAQLESKLAEHHGRAGRRYLIASGGGRMQVTMDRYEADWAIVERGWKAHVLGEARNFESTRAAIETFQAESPGISDQMLPPFVVADENGPVGRVQDGDAVVLFNFRGDRAIQFSRAFDDDDFPHFDRKHRPKTVYAGMMEYDGDYHIPKRYLVAPPSIDGTMGEYLADAGVSQFACSETQKFGHVTFFWNGNRGGKFNAALETYVEVPSDRVDFSERPWMKAAEVTDATITAIESGKHRFMRINYANGDMVGHTGDLNAAVLAVETVDLCLARLLRAAEKHRASVLITADHGNAEEMYLWNAKKKDFDRGTTGLPLKKTSHTLNKVPLYLVNGPAGASFRTDLARPGLANVAATTFELLGFEPPSDYEPSLLHRR